MAAVAGVAKVVTPALTAGLSTPDIVRSYAGPVLVAVSDSALGAYISAVSGHIERFVRRRLPRERVEYRYEGSNTPYLYLPRLRTPLLSVVSIKDAVTDIAASAYEIVSSTPPTVGFTDSAYIWEADAPVYDGRAGYFSRKRYTVDYWCGYLVPGDDLVGVTTLSASSVDNSFRLSSGKFPYLIPGDSLVVAGFSNAANNGTFTVLSRSDDALTVSGALVTEAAGASINVSVSTLPEAYVLATNLAVISLVNNQSTELTSVPGVTSERAADLSVDYGNGGSGGLSVFGDLPKSVKALLFSEVNTLIGSH